MLRVRVKIHEEEIENSEMQNSDRSAFGLIVDAAGCNNSKMLYKCNSDSNVKSARNDSAIICICPRNGFLCLNYNINNISAFKFF